MHGVRRNRIAKLLNNISPITSITHGVNPLRPQCKCIVEPGEVSGRFVTGRMVAHMTRTLEEMLVELHAALAAYRRELGLPPAEPWDPTESFDEGLARLHQMTNEARSAVGLPPVNDE